MGRKGGFHHSEETRRKMSLAHVGRKKSPEHCAKIAQALRGRKRSQETIAKMRAGALGHKMSAHQVEALRIRMRGRGNPWWGKTTLHGPRTHWHHHNGVALRSRWEVRFAQALDHRGLRWDYEPQRFDLGTCTYLPDFFVPETGAYWEVKGWFDPKSQRKIALFRERHPDLPLIVVDAQLLTMMEGET